MHSLTINIEILLKRMATMLPVINVHSHQKEYITGKEILAWGTITQINNTPIVQDRVYLWKFPVISNANHYRRLKKRYQAKGIEGVKEYLEWINGLSKGTKIEKQMLAIQTIIKTIEEHRNK